METLTAENAKEGMIVCRQHDEIVKNTPESPGQQIGELMDRLSVMVAELQAEWRKING